MCAQRVQLKTTIDGLLVPLNPYTDCVKNVRLLMPLAGSKLLGTTVLYVGPTTDAYSTGVCYTCKATESSSYYWEAVAAGSSGATNITVNGISPDADGNILLKAENISFSSKNSMGEDFPCSASIDRQNLQTFFESIQYAIFSVNGYSAYFDSDNDRLIGDITIYGNTMYLTEDDASPGSDWDGNPLNEKTVYDLASDVYIHSVKEISTDDGNTYSTAENGKLNLTISCPVNGWVANDMGAEFGAYVSLSDILDILSRKSIKTINDNPVWNEDTGNIKLSSQDIPWEQYTYDEWGNEIQGLTVYDVLYYKVNYPDFNTEPYSREADTEYSESETGYLVVRVSFVSAPPDAPVTVELNGNIVAKLKPGASEEWQTFFIPLYYDFYIVRTPTPSVGTIWRIEVEFIPTVFR